jgi:hypothetical protein
MRERHTEDWSEREALYECQYSSQINSASVEKKIQKRSRGEAVEGGNKNDSSVRWKKEKKAVYFRVGFRLQSRKDRRQQ